MTDDTEAERFEGLDDETRAHLSGLYHAIQVANEEAAKHERHLDRIAAKDDDTGRSHHTSCRNAAESVSRELFREAITAALSPRYSRFYHRDKKRSDEEETSDGLPPHSIVDGDE